jgi:hypothetical protein
MYAIKGNSIGHPVSFQRVGGNSDLPDGYDFIVGFHPLGYLLSEDGVSLRLPTQAEMLDMAKATKRDEINAARDAALDAGFVFDGNTYDSDAKSIQRITGAATLAIIDNTFTTNWITKDNGVVSLSAAQLIALGQAAAAHEQRLIFKARQLKDQINAATTRAEVDEVSWDTAPS